ncbi:flagellar export chaperone FlgN [Desulfoluna spongiiphila]|uniref:FlgN protein n=1 Tax=Desulfoluna spongiiphila TaxID=419481 RepID=A0A1G5J4T1_9BACT|nr:flagellar export chaperone FlgN [Desulfoluna spongiiphila]SCY82698.1 FlgN protein [Desulfoluna spongiiphila]VVS94457.1 flgn-like protein [Desulfoluna spongiiphila]
MAAHSIIDLLEKKEALYTELLAIVDEESQSLSTIALDRLWAFTEEKSRLSVEIDALRDEILQLASARLGIQTGSVPMHLRELPRLFSEHEPMIARSVESIIFVKGKIRKIAESSVSFVENYLETVEEIIHMLTSSTSDTKIYGMDRHLMEPGGSLLIHGEA